MQQNIQECIDDCKRCHETCLRMAMTHCLQLGGRHVEQEHMQLMIGCAEICQTAANFMMYESPVHGAVCAACADVCDACAKSCEDVGDMDECVTACLRCADSCREMATTFHPGSRSGRSALTSARPQ